MANNITDILKEASKDILTEEVLKEIETAFDSSVNERVQIHVEKALSEQDEDYSKKLETLVEAIDTDHTNKLKKVVEAIDADRANKLKQVVEKYEATLKTEAANFKNEIVDQVSKYLDLYLEEKLPAKDIAEAVKNKRALSVLEGLRSQLSIDMVLANDNIRDAVVDGKKRIDEAAGQLEAANKKIEQLANENKKMSADLLLEQKSTDLDKERKAYIKKMLGSKSLEFIKENFDYTLKLYERSEEERLTNLKTEAVTEAVATSVDRPIIEEKVATEQTEDDPTFTTYLSELKKY